MALDISINRDACMGSGNCSFWAPGVFDLDDDGIAWWSTRRHSRGQGRARCARLSYAGDQRRA